MTPLKIDIQFNQDPGNIGNGHGSIDVGPLDDQQSRDLQKAVKLDGVDLISNDIELKAGNHLAYGFYNTRPDRLEKDAHTVEAAAHGLGLEVAPKEGIAMAASPEYRKSNGSTSAYIPVGEQWAISAQRADEIQKGFLGISAGFKEVGVGFEAAEKAYDPPKYAIRTAELLAAGHLALEGVNHEAISPGATVQHLPEQPVPAKAPEHLSQAA